MSEFMMYAAESQEFYGERLSLVMDRLQEITEESVERTAIFKEYYAAVTATLQLQRQLAKSVTDGTFLKKSLEEAQTFGNELYGSFRPGKYEESYANPTYAKEKLGEAYGPLLSAVYSRIINRSAATAEGDLCWICIYAELLVEIHTLLEDPESEPSDVKDCVYSFMSDYAELFTEDRVLRSITTRKDFVQYLVTESDFRDLSYLYRYGTYVSDNALGTAEYLNTLSQEEINAMAATYTEGYRKGFEMTGKDISKKKVAEIRYPMGFERMAKAASLQFAAMGLQSMFRCMSFPVNKQMDYDHREDAALWMDKAYVERNIEDYRKAFEAIKEVAPWYGGPAVIECFGEEPFTPVTNPDAPKYDGRQQELDVYLRDQFSQQLHFYIHGEERSFTIIAYPLPEIDDSYKEIFGETVKLNNLDYTLYQGIQQKLIDALDQADRVHIVGMGKNETNLYVNIWSLSDPDHQTAFENCVADVNIPVGEVFTSPVLPGTNGVLHVTSVYLNELKYENLRIQFQDGRTAQYSCTNFDKEEENKAYIEENLLFHHPFLPMGEFAIGTNTTAYAMGRNYDIAGKLPILIAEKTGPHFAIGDTCYSYEEDLITYNPDGKAIVARENEISALRREDPAKAYFHCHTDITIPYDELGLIEVVRRDGSTIPILSRGRFVLPGTEELNIPLENLL